MDVRGIDSISLSCYKFGGATKTASLVVSKRLKNIICSNPLLNTELVDVSGGTLSVPSILASHKALKYYVSNREAKNARLLYLKNMLIQMLSTYFRFHEYKPDIDKIILKAPANQWFCISYSNARTIGGTLLFTLIRNKTGLDGVCGFKLKEYLRSNNIIVSNGSACHSESSHGSHVLTAMGVPAKLQQGVIRVSLSDTSVKYELAQLVASIVHYIKHVYQ